MKIAVEVEALNDESFEYTGEYRIPLSDEHYSGGHGEVRAVGKGSVGRTGFIVKKKVPDDEVILLKRPTVNDVWNQLFKTDRTYSVVYQSTGHSSATVIHNLKITVDNLLKEVRIEGISDSDLEEEAVNYSPDLSQNDALHAEKR